MTGRSIQFKHLTDEQGNPVGGYSHGCGFTITWQAGPLGRGEHRKEPNGAFVEDIIAAAANRLQYYQNSKFASTYNRDALLALQAALTSLKERTEEREHREVEGTHAV